MPANSSGHRRWTSRKHRRMSQCRSVFHWSAMSRNQSRAMGVDEGLAALGSAAAGLVFNGRSGGTRRLDVGELLACERPVDGFSWSPPGRALQADAKRELVMLKDMLLKSAFPELLSTGPAAGRLRVPVWWPIQTNRQGDGGPLGPHVVARGSIQIN